MVNSFEKRCKSPNVVAKDQANDFIKPRKTFTQAGLYDDQPSKNRDRSQRKKEDKTDLQKYTNAAATKTSSRSIPPVNLKKQRSPTFTKGVSHVASTKQFETEEETRPSNYEQQLLNPQFLKDKSIKKVSLATLKRRKLLEQQEN
mmetsp:Transcript_1212/g.1371  ORF Transcript_1212/g.1371 Transcript_1212/m.1371 type:complete len:145 (+) Transcript_1212:1884-2318(+)